MSSRHGPACVLWDGSWSGHTGPYLVPGLGAALMLMLLLLSQTLCIDHSRISKGASSALCQTATPRHSLGEAVPDRS